MTEGVTWRLNMELVSAKVQPPFLRAVACVAGEIGPKENTTATRIPPATQAMGWIVFDPPVARIKKPTLGSLLRRISPWVFQYKWK